MPKRLIIVSDMQFNQAIETRIDESQVESWDEPCLPPFSNIFSEDDWSSNLEFNEYSWKKSMTNFEVAKKIYELAGYELPKIVFWNVNGNICEDVPVHATESNVSLVSGFSIAILESILNDELITPLMMVESVLEDDRYKDMRELVEGAENKDENDEFHDALENLQVTNALVTKNH